MHHFADRRRVAIAMRATLVAAIFASLVAIPTSAATSASDAEAMIIGWVNNDRTRHGLVPLRRYGSLASIAGVRAGRMASANVMSHTIGGNLSSQLSSYGVTWYRYGEGVGYSSAGWSVDAARTIYRMWMNSTPHRALLLSSRFNYIGVGLAHRSSNRRTFASAVMAETPDKTRPIARVTGASRSGDDVRWTWSGYDLRLQTHTAGLRDFDILYRVGSGPGFLVRNNTTSTSLTLANRPRGQTYSIRVRGTDRRGNVGAWSSEMRVWVP